MTYVILMLNCIRNENYLNRGDFLGNNNEIAKSIGGQAVLEGVMMRGKTGYCMAVRNMVTKEIGIEEKDIPNRQNSILKMPLIRGVVNFIDSMILGMKILTSSSNMAGIDDLEEDEKKSKFDIWLENKFGDKLVDYIIYFSVCLSLVISVSLFMVLPVWISSFITKTFNISLWGIGIVEGLVRFAIFLSYIFIISKLDDVQRLFKYHGAEHKTINCYEKGLELNIENVRKSTRLHKRCGTSFLIIVMIVSMIVFMFLRTDDIIIRTISRIVLVPVIAGISYEIIKLAGKHDNFLINMISAPGMALQKITTAEPEDEMIEVAILALKGVLLRDGGIEVDESGQEQT